MKILFILMTTCLMQVSAFTYAQRITLSEKNATLISVFEKISKQSGVDFLVTNELLAGTRNINIQVKDKALTEVLDRIFEGQPLTYSLKDQAVIVKRKEPSFLDKARAVTLNLVQGLLQDPVRGVVKDEQGNPLPNASIRVRGKSAVTNTNAKGEFTIENVADDAVLLVSYVGYKTLEISLKDAVMPLEIKLNQTTGELEEVKIEYSTGYQNIPKERATGSYAFIGKDLFNRQLGTNVLDKILNVTSGLNFERRNQNFATRSGINIRGISTINANQKPLIVVDDFPYEGDINNLNPNDVASITVLKDAAAASIWGVKAGNGVIVVTTKKGGFNQRQNIQLNSNVTVGEKRRIFTAPLTNVDEVIDFQKNLFATGYYNDYDDSYPLFNSFPAIPKVAEILLAQRRGDISEDKANEQIEALRKNDIRRDINKYLNQNSISQQSSLSFSGGQEKYNYYVSIGYDKNRSTAVGDKDQRLTVRFDNTFRPIKNLEVNGYILYTNSNSEMNSVSLDGLAGSPYNRISDEFGNPQAVPYRIRQVFIDTASYPELLDWRFVPLDELANKDNSSRRLETRLGVGAKYAINPYLIAEIRYQYQNEVDRLREFNNLDTYFTRNFINSYMSGTPGNIVYGVPLGGILNMTSIHLNSWNIRGQVNLNKKWNKNNITALVGLEAREVNIDENHTRKYGYDEQTNSTPITDYITWFPYFSGDGFSARNVEYVDYIRGNISRNKSVFANAGYTYDGKYTFTASSRIDGSNFFGIAANQRKVPLWSAGIGWDISKEVFYQIDWVPYLNLRLTHGFNGNTNNSAAAYPLISFGIAGFTQAPAATLISPPNPHLRWERVKMTNFAVDFKTRDNRISGSIEYYLKKGLDLISDIQIDPTTGFEKYIGNNATINGKGWDIIFNTTNIQYPKFTWASNILLSLNKDKVTAYNIIPTSISQYTTEETPLVGKPLYKIFSYRWAGLDPLNGAARVLINGQPTPYNEAVTKDEIEDLVYSGQTLPKIFGAFRNTISFSKISFSINVTYKFGHFFRRNSVDYLNLYNGLHDHSDYSKRWRQPGDEQLTDVPSVPLPTALSTFGAIYQNSDILVDKADYIRIQDARIGYDFNASRLQQLGIRSARLFVYVNNIGLVWTANKHNIDPENQLQLSPRSLAVGAYVNF